MAASATSNSGMYMYTWFLVLFSLCPTTPGEKVLGVETDDFDFDGLPGATHEFKMFVGAGREECLFQKIAAGGKLHVRYEVLRGGDKAIDASLKNPRDEFIESRIMHQRWRFDWTVDVAGDHVICLDNTYSRMASKLVYLYISTHVQEEWDSFVKELTDVHLTVRNFTHSINEVKLSLTEVLNHQANGRMNVLSDWYRVNDNNRYVKVYSIVQCVIIVVAACFQVYFVRRLFSFSNVTPTSKPRA